VVLQVKQQKVSEIENPSGTRFRLHLMNYIHLVVVWIEILRQRITSVGSKLRLSSQPARNRKWKPKRAATPGKKVGLQGEHVAKLQKGQRCEESP
jgi:hypothetical protein